MHSLAPTMVERPGGHTAQVADPFALANVRDGQSTHAADVLEPVSGLNVPTGQKEVSGQGLPPLRGSGQYSPAEQLTSLKLPAGQLVIPAHLSGQVKLPGQYFFKHSRSGVVQFVGTAMSGLGQNVLGGHLVSFSTSRPNEQYSPTVQSTNFR